MLRIIAATTPIAVVTIVSLIVLRLKITNPQIKTINSKLE